MKILRTAVCVGLLASSALAHAGIYEFSYDFLNGDKITGRFFGKEINGLIRNWNNISVSVNGDAFPTDLYASGGISGAGPTASFDGLSNDFSVYSGSNRFYSIFAGRFNASTTDYIDYSRPSGLVSEGPFGNPAYDAARWSLKEIPMAVPEPATYAMMFGGLALIGAIARRRNPAV